MPTLKPPPQTRGVPHANREMAVTIGRSGTGWSGIGWRGLAAGESEPRRLAALDSLRAFAAYSVVLFHYTYGYTRVVAPHSQSIPAFRYGHFGVELFFVISGFVILWTLERSKSIYDFALRRFARLYPPYVAGLLITGALVFGIGFNPLHLHVSSIAFSAIIGLPHLVGARDLDPSYWTLGLEISFYTVAAVATFTLPIRFEAACLCWIAASVLTRVFLPTHSRLHMLIASDFSAVFVSGAMLFRLMQSQWRNVLALATLGVALLTCFFAQGTMHPDLPPAVYGVMICLFVALVYFSVVGNFRILNFQPLVMLGQASYSLYLIHQIIGYWIIDRLERAGWSSAAAITIAILSVTSIALLMRRFIEAPTHALLTRRLGRSSSRRLELSGSRAGF